MEELLELTLAYAGSEADNSEIDLYDVAQALIGFQRSLALTTHLVLNDEIITQAPFLKGARILAAPPEEGSWKITALVMGLATGAYHLGTAPKDTPLGHIVRSAYDYVISEAIGVHVDYDKTIGQQYEELRKQKSKLPELSQERLDSLVEKCETAVRDMHRPIAKSRTADEATITAKIGGKEHSLSRPLTLETYDFIAYTERSTSALDFSGRISSYNINTFKSRVYLPQHNRPVPFELAEHARDTLSVLAIVRSLSANAQRQPDGQGAIYFNAFQNLTRTGRLKSLLITEVRDMQAR